MAALHNLTELLKNSRKLPSDDTVATALRSAPFTFIGSSSLVAVNAFAPVTHESHDMYEEMQQEAEARPSPASFAARVFLLGKQTSRTQTIVYNGISGSGKTYLAGAVTDCFCQMAQNSTKAHQLQALLAVMASMTQAKNTSSSPSASRCASLLELHFAPTTKQSDLLGGKILPFAFDKQRLLRYSGDERTFNVFYEMMAAASPRERQEWGLRDLPSDYALLNQTASSLSGYDEASEEARARDRKAFDMFRQALAVLQISPRAVSSIFRLLSAIMVLYNLTFDKSDDGHVQVAYDAQPDLEIAATLLNVQPDELEHLLLNKTRFVKKDLVSFLLDADGCNVQRNNFCQTLYTLLLVCLTDTANLTFALSDEELVSNQAAGGFSILQLDMPGFQGHTARWAGDRGSTLLQSIGTDGFEEFRTNYSQEMLQHWLMSRNFEETRGESVLVASEGLSLPPVEIIDRSPGRMELLRGDVLKSKADTKPTGLVGGLHTISTDLRKGKEVEGSADRTFLEQLRASSVSHSSFSVDAGLGIASSRFGVQHFASTVAYDVTGFVDGNIDAVDVSVVALLKTSEDPFIANLLSSSRLGFEGHPKDPREVVTAQISDVPYARPSPLIGFKGDTVKFAGRTAGISPSLTQLNSYLSSLFPFLDQSHVWTAYCLRSNAEEVASNLVDYRFLKHQVTAFSLAQLTGRLVSDFVASYTLQEMAALLNKAPMASEELKELLLSYGLQAKTDFAVGKARVFVSYGGFKKLDLYQAAPLARLVAIEQPAPSPLLSPNVSPASKTVPLPSHARRPSSSAAELIRMHRQMEQEAQVEHLSDHSDVSDQQSMQHRRNDTLQTLVNASPTPSPRDDYFGTTVTRRSSYTLADNSSPDWKAMEKEEMEADRESISNLMRKGTVKSVAEDEEGITRSRLIWLIIVWFLTWPIPDLLLMIRKKFRRPDVRLAWREKVACCMLIAGLCAGIIFYIVFLGLIICPEYNKVWNSKELSYHQGKNDFFVAIRGEVYDLTDFWQYQHSDISAQPVEDDDMLALAGQDITNYFPIPLTTACPNLVTNENLALSYKTFQPVVSMGIHYSGHLQPATNTALNDENWYFRSLLPAMRRYHKGPLVWSRSNITKSGSTDDELKQKTWATYNHRIYDLTDYMWTLQANPDAKLYQFLNPDIVAIFQGQSGGDITAKLDALDISDEDRQNTMQCIERLFFVGYPDPRELPRCRIQPYSLLGFSALIVLIVLVKFLAALQFGTKRVPEPRDKFVIITVPCYSEGDQSLRETINSIASLRYENTRKLLLVICDGQVVGAGNDKTTPSIVLDILGASTAADVDAAEPLLYQAIGEGAKQLSYAKVYSGLYEYEGQVLPYLVVVKVGKPSERVRPGNRGKRDSQVLLLRFLNRVHFDSEMAPLELEMYHQIKNVIGVDPSAYTYLLCLDADTVCEPTSLNRLIAIAHDDTHIIGLCGETQIANHQSSWVSLVQNYEYWVSQHCAKAFESLFNSVTCLPGCFTLYRLKGHDDNKPLLISDKIIDDYSQTNIDTLHKKNLFLLGEDRYLTTLLLKHFPEYKTKFTAEAQAKTVVPDTWKVLLSQRRRWINSTIHNLIELLGADNLCGACCFSMRFVVLIDLIGTLILPASFGYLVYLIVEVSLHKATVPTFSLILLAAVYGLQCILFLLKRQFQFVFWLIIYIAGFPLFGFVLPLYSFWHFDDVAWGKTRVVVGEGKKRKVLAALDEEVFDKSMIPMRKFGDYQAQAWQDEQPEPAPQFAQMPSTTFRTSYSPSVMSRAPSAQFMGGHSPLPGTPPVPSPYHHSPSHTPFGSLSSTSNLQLAMPMPVMPYNAWAPPPGSYAGSGHGNSVVGTPSEHGRPTSYAPSFAMDRGRSASIGSQLSAFRASSPFVANGAMPSPSLNTEPSDAELKEAVRMYLMGQDLMKVTKRSTREAIQRQFPKADLSTKKELLNQSIDAYCSA